MTASHSLFHLKQFDINQMTIEAKGWTFISQPQDCCQIAIFKIERVVKLDFPHFLPSSFPQTFRNVPLNFAVYYSTMREEIKEKILYHTVVKSPFPVCNSVWKIEKEDYAEE